MGGPYESEVSTVLVVSESNQACQGMGTGGPPQMRRRLLSSYSFDRDQLTAPLLEVRPTTPYLPRRIGPLPVMSMNGTSI